MSSLAGPAFAQSRDAARELANKGYEQFEAGHFDEAAETFKRADATYHAPTIVAALALALEKGGHLIEARAAYERVANEPLDANATPEFKRAQAAAQKSVEGMEGRIPSVLVVVRGAVPRDVKLSIDGAAKGTVTPGKRFALNPGKHAFDGATSDGSAHLDVDIAEGSRASIELVFTPKGTVAPPPVVTDTPPVDDAPKPPPKPVDDAPKEGSYLPAILALSVGGAGMIVGTAAGLATLTKADDVKSRCDGAVCRISDADAASQAKMTGTVSTIGFIAGGLGLAGGLVLLAVRKTPQAPALSLSLSPSSLTARGTF